MKIAEITVIGKVIAGFDVLNKINNVETDNTNPQNPKPKTDIILNSVEIIVK